MKKKITQLVFFSFILLVLSIGNVNAKDTKKCTYKTEGKPTIYLYIDINNGKATSARLSNSDYKFSSGSVVSDYNAGRTDCYETIIISTNNYIYFFSSEEAMQNDPDIKDGGIVVSENGTYSLTNQTSENGDAELMDVNSVCNNSNYRKITRYIGWVIGIIKIAVPLLLLVFGLLDFYKAAMSGKDDTLPKTIKTFIIRLIAAVVIFFIPATISFIFGMLDDWNGGYKSNYTLCTECLLIPSDC